jgi:hypothetical protein
LQRFKLSQLYICDGWQTVANLGVARELCNSFVNRCNNRRNCSCNSFKPWLYFFLKNTHQKLQRFKTVANIFFNINFKYVLFTIMAYKLNVALQYSYKSKKIKMHKIYKYKLLNLSHIIHTSKDSKSKKLV